MKLTPYTKTIFLDCDIVVVSAITELFNVLKDNDVAVTTLPFKNKYYGVKSFQSGFLCFKRNQHVMDFLELWDKIYDRSVWLKGTADQLPFTRALLASPLKIFVLPTEYNFRVPCISYAREKIKVFHCHDLIMMDPSVIEKIVCIINKHERERVWFPGRGIRIIKKNLLTSFLTVAEYRLKNVIFNRMMIMRPYRMLSSFLTRKNLSKKRFVLYQLPRLMDWTMPGKYRKRMELYHEKLTRLSND